MSAQRMQLNRGAGLPLKAVIASTSAWYAIQLGPPVINGEIVPLAAGVTALAVYAGLHTIIDLVHHAAQFVDWWGGRTPTGRAGTSDWAVRRDFKEELSPTRTGPFWGRSFATQDPLFIDYESNALVLGPSGSSKGIASVIPNILFCMGDKIVADFKGENVVVTKPVLEARGEKVVVLNASGIFSESIGDTDSCNPLDPIVDNFYRPGGLLDVPGDLREISAQLLQEPEGKETDNSYFREGGRVAIGFGIVVEVMVDGYDATLSNVALLIEDRLRLEFIARWVLGVDLNDNPHPNGPFPIEQTNWARLHDPAELMGFATWLGARAQNILGQMSGDDTRTFDSFITGAQQALAPFAFGTLSKVMGKSTFRVEELKEGEQTVSLFNVADPSRMQAYKPYLGLFHWHCFTAIKRHPNKQRRVRAFLDEASNYKINGLEDLLTWGRSYGLSLEIVIQDLMAFMRAYGPTAVDTLLSETEIKQLMPGNRSPKTLEMISKQILGDRSVMAVGTGRSAGQFVSHENISEQARPLMTPDEVRRADHGILIVRRLPPIAFEPISYAEIAPFRDEVGINPFHGKRFKKRIKLNIS